MFNRFVTYLLLLALISINLSRFFTCMGFELNRNYIAANLCENKAKPYLHCNGKCYLMKKIRQAEENEKKQNNKDRFNRLVVSFFQEHIGLTFLPPVSAPKLKNKFPTDMVRYSSRCKGAIFKPPRLLI